tara:strand:+ start:2090 stop:2932 length:843 start_codon:yes stop_codon:yes gene_type:complete
MKYYLETLKDMETINQINKEKWRGRRNSAKNLVKSLYSYTLKPIKDHLGFKGVVGGTAGFVLAGPIGGITGATAGKYSKELGKITKKGINGVSKGVKGISKGLNTVIETITESGLYEEIDSDSSFQRSNANYSECPRKENFQDKKLDYIKDLANYFISNPLKFMGNGITNTAKRTNNILENSREYKKLEKIAQKISIKEGEDITPGIIYESMQKEKQNKKDMKILNKLREELLFTKMYKDQNNLTREQKNDYNQKVSEHNFLCWDLGIRNPKEYFPKIKY